MPIPFFDNSNTYTKADSLARNNKISSTSNNKKLDFFLLKTVKMQNNSYLGRGVPWEAYCQKMHVFNSNRRVSPGISSIVLHLLLLSTVSHSVCSSMPSVRNCHHNNGIVYKGLNVQSKHLSHHQVSDKDLQPQPPQSNQFLSLFH